MNRKTNEEFLREIALLPLKPLGVYTTCRGVLDFQCKICGEIWKTTPNRVLHGSTCPNCSRRNNVVARSGTTLTIDIATPKHPDVIMLIDERDWELVKQTTPCRVYAWTPSKVVYAVTYVECKRKTIHQLILPEAREVDHKNGNGCDNRRANLRACDRKQNAANKAYRVGISGVRGVAPKGKKWRACIMVDRKNYFSKVYSTVEEAAQARKALEKKYHKEFSYAASRD